MLNTTPDQFLQTFIPDEHHLYKGIFHFLKTKSPIQHYARIRAARKFIDRLDQIEQTPVHFSSTNKSVSQNSSFLSYLQLGKTLLSSLKDHTHEDSRDIALKLKRRLVALSYRLEIDNGGYNPTKCEPSLLNQLIEIATNWKGVQACFYEKSLTDQDIVRLQSCCEYPEFLKVVFSDVELQHELFCWVLRDKITVRPFIEYPALQEKITCHGLNGRIGVMGGDQLQIQKCRIDGSNTLEKIVTLPFEGRNHSILNPQDTVTFRGNYTMTIEEIFEVFGKKKSFIMGDLEYFADGINNWNVNCLGWWDADKEEYCKVNLDRPYWWKELPLFEILTKKEAQMRYGEHLNGTHWNVAAVASRSTMTLDVYGNHAFLEVAIPLGEDRYGIYDFGKAAEQFPSDPIQIVTRSCENFEGVICFPDENVFYTHRQHVSHSFPISKEEGMKIMAAIKTDLLKARAGNLVYQIQSENCAEWTQLILEGQLGSRVPNLFRLPYLSAEPTGALGKVFSFIKSLPQILQKELLMLFHIPFGAKKGRWIIDRGQKIWKSMTNHAIWNHAEIYLPAFLHKQIECQSFAFSTCPMKNVRNNIILRENMIRTFSHSPLLLMKLNKTKPIYVHLYQRIKDNISGFFNVLDRKFKIDNFEPQPKGGGGASLEVLEELSKLQIKN